jgi:putative hydrolase of the HAD superfamily
MTLRAIFFDFGGTLASLAPSLEEPWRVWSQVAEQFQLNISDSEIQRVNEEADVKFGERIYVYHGRTAEFWRLRDMWVMDQLGVVTRKREFFSTLQAVFEDPARIQLYPETLDVLRELRARELHIGVISNFTDGLLPILKHHGLDVLLDSITYSQEVGVEKPNPRVFLRALMRANCRPEDAVHIGDLWESDYVGATGVGMTAVWLNRNRNPAPVACQEIRNLRQLPSLLTANP